MRWRLIKPLINTKFHFSDALIYYVEGLMIDEFRAAITFMTEIIGIPPGETPFILLSQLYQLSSLDDIHISLLVECHSILFHNDALSPGLHLYFILFLFMF